MQFACELLNELERSASSPGWQPSYNRSSSGPPPTMRKPARIRILTTLIAALLTLTPITGARDVPKGGDIEEV